MPSWIVDQVRQAGVVGAGGAGFPTHVKLDAEVDTYIVNAAECEPLLYKDKELVRLYASRLVHGLRLGMEATGARRGVVAIKGKYHDAIAALEPHMVNGLEIFRLGNFYPAGDEYVVVYEVTGRLIPPGGIPLQVGCVVNNVETLLNVSLASEGIPVTHTWLTVTGAVRSPGSFSVPVGITAAEAVALAGGAEVDDPVALEGGAMMARPVRDLARKYLTKTTGGIVVLPKDHPLFVRKTTDPEVLASIGRSACDQCSQCTELCPRYLLGYGIEPHKVMRSLGMAGEAMEGWARLGLLCSECGLCTFYSCPEGLSPGFMCVRSKRALGSQRPPLPEGRGRPHPMRDYRKVPVDRLVRRLGLTEWDRPAPMRDVDYQPRQVRLLLEQHVGAPAVPVVTEGQVVKAGQLVADIQEGKLGARIHASISGTVTRIDDKSIWISR